MNSDATTSKSRNRRNLVEHKERKKSTQKKEKKTESKREK